MFAITPFTISGLFIFASFLPLFLFITFRGKNLTARIYSVHALAVMCWGIGAFFIGLIKNEALAFKVWQYTFVAICLIPVSFQHTVQIFTNKKNIPEIVFIYSQAIFFCYLSLKGTLFDTELLFGSFYYLITTPIHSVFTAIWFFIVIKSHAQLFLYYRKCYPNQKNQVLALFLSFVGFIGGGSNFLATFHINFYPIGNFLVPFNSFIVSYAILKHQLMDINIAIKRSVVYSTLAAIISTAYLLIVIFLEKILQNTFEYTSWGISIVSAFLIGIIIIPLKDRIQKLADRFIFPASPEELVEQNEKLRQELATAEKYKLLGTLSGGIAHEIKNPLTAIKTFSDKLPEKSHDQKFLQKFSKIVGQEVERIDDLVHQLLDYSRPATPHPQSADLHKLLNDTLSFLSNNFHKNKINIERKYAAKKHTISVDQSQIRQAFINIFLNAIDAMPTGGTFSVTTESTQDFFTISIKDTGAGILAKDVPHIFEPFFTKKDNGTGLGLAITQTIIKNHNGKINVKSKVGVGTEFIIELPLNSNKTKEL